jgi:hypothetical protein
MSYSQVGITNLALIKIGAKRITAMTEDSESAIVANAIWQYIRDEVLAAKDWRFAKTRVALAQNATSPAYMFDYAYTLPADFLRLARQDKSDASVFPSGLYSEDLITGMIYLNENYYPYKIEAISDGTLCLVSNYDNTDDDLFITYIQKVTDVNKYSPDFVSALSFRLAAEMATAITESRAKYQDMMNLYESSLKRAEQHTQSMDYIEETGANDWSEVGR